MFACMCTFFTIILFKGISYLAIVFMKLEENNYIDDIRS